MSERAGKAIAIIGGGATGVILAANLLRAAPQMRVTIIERGPRLGRGLAYSTRQPEHRLNVPASRMSAFIDEPLDFWNWYRAQNANAGSDPDAYLQRRDYARYLDHVFERAVGEAVEPGQLRWINAECTAISPVGSGLELRLSNGTSLVAQAAVIATGHEARPLEERSFASSSQDTPDVAPDDRVLIIGTGLSMIDTWLTLEANGHKGEIVAVSRRGLMPRSHGTRQATKLDAADIPFGTELGYFARWLSALIDETERAGGNWRDVIDGIRPYNQRIWRNWPTSAKRRFMQHAKSWWDVHRHRLAPDIHARATKAIEDGRLKLIAGRIRSATSNGDGSVTVTIARRGSDALLTLDCAAAVDCTGVVKDPSTSPNPLIASIIRSGLARPDPLRIGLDVTLDCELIDRNGAVSDRILAAGPPTRGTFFEIDAVPEIREQCSRIAARLAGCC